jgi:hypothetical protein
MEPLPRPSLEGSPSREHGTGRALLPQSRRTVVHVRLRAYALSDARACEGITDTHRVPYVSCGIHLGSVCQQTTDAMKCAI